VQRHGYLPVTIYFNIFRRICLVQSMLGHHIIRRLPGARVAQWVRSLDLTAHTSLSPIRRGFAPSFVSYKKGCTRLPAASDKAYQLFPQGRWFSPGTPASSTTKIGRHDIAEILLKVALNTKNQSINHPVEGCSIHYMLKFVGVLRQVGGLLRVLWSPSPIKLTATI